MRRKRKDGEKARGNERGNEKEKEAADGYWGSEK